MHKLVYGDCLLELQKISNHSVDLIIADPPYNISKPDNHIWGLGGRQGLYFGEWDENFNQTDWIRYAANTLKENANIVIFNCWSNLGLIQQECEKQHICIKRCLVLSKRNPAPFNKDRMFVNDVEFALWGVYNSKNKPKAWCFNRQEPLEKCVIQTTVQSSKYHPTMKDIKVIEKLILLLSNKNDLVVDPFIGSGTTGIAAKKLERSFIGIEINKKYYDIAKERICKN